MAKATLFSRLLTHEDLEPNLVNNEVIGNIKNEENNNDEIVSQGSVRDKELVVQESLLNENDNWGPGETIKTLWYAIRERAGGLGNFFLNMFKSYDASGLRKLLTELESGSRIVKPELTDTDKEKLNKIFGSIGEFDYDVGGNCKDIITFINNVMDTLDKNKRGSFGWILDNKFDIENGRKALVKDNVSSELFSRLLKAHPEGFSIDPRSDNYVAGYIVNPFATHLSIYSIMYIPQLDSIKTESDIIRNPRPANVFPATLDGAKALLKFGIDFEDKIKNLASKIKLDSLKTSTIESHLSLRDAAYYSARALSTLDRKLEDAIKVFTKRHIDTSNEDLDTNTDTCVSSTIDKEFTNPELSSKLNETVNNLNDAIDSNDEVLMTKVGEATVEMLQELKYEYNLPVMTTVSKEDFIYDPKGCCKKLCIELSNEFFGWFGGKKETNKGPKCGAMHGDGVTGINDSSAKCLSLISKFKRLKETITSDKKTFVTKSLDNNMIVTSFKPTYSTSIYACMGDMLNNLKSIDKYISSNYNHKDFFKTLKDVSKYLKPKVLENYKPRSNDKLLAVTWEFINIGNRREHYLYGTSVTHSDIDYGGAILDAVYIGNPYSQSGFSFYIEETKGVVDSYTKGYSAKSEIDSTLKILEELEPILEKLKKYNSTHITSNKYILDIEDPEGSKEDKISDIVYSVIDNGIGDCLLGIVSLANAIYHCMLDTFEESDLSE